MRGAGVADTVKRMGWKGLSRTIAVLVTTATATVSAVATGTPAIAAETPGQSAATGRSGPSDPSQRPDLRPYYHQTVAWEPCDRKDRKGRLQCGWLTVPRDYGDPARGELRIRVERLPATGPGARLGSLVTNPGGPGESGVGFLAGSVPLFAHLNTRYDIVTFDPRGTGRSAPVTCGTQGPPSQESGGDIEQLFAKQKFINDACERHSGAILPWVGTPDVARDMDVLRAADGDARLDYLGFSYGTKLGADYAHAFPGRVGRTVLDSVEDPTTNMLQTALAQVRSQQQAADAFADDCATHHPDCPLGHQDAAARAQLQTWYDRLAEHPLRADGQTVDESTYIEALRSELYSQDDWPTLRTALLLLKRGDARAILLISNLGQSAGSTVPGGAAGARDTAGRDPLPAQTELAQRAVECRDTSERYGIAAFESAAVQLVRASELFGPAAANPLSACSGWPVRGDDTSRDVRAPGAAGMLLVANTTDPATPYQGAAHMAHALGNADTVLTVRTSGHAAYGSDNVCVHRTVDAFLLDGTMPPKNTTCR
jgi:pimeloyl-ACP methyl ester carboxylesterase